MTAVNLPVVPGHASIRHVLGVFFVSSAVRNLQHATPAAVTERALSHPGDSWFSPSFFQKTCGAFRSFVSILHHRTLSGPLPPKQKSPLCTRIHNIPVVRGGINGGSLVMHSHARKKERLGEHYYAKVGKALQ